MINLMKKKRKMKKTNLKNRSPWLHCDESVPSQEIRGCRAVDALSSRWYASTPWTKTLSAVDILFVNIVSLVSKCTPKTDPYLLKQGIYSFIICLSMIIYFSENFIPGNQYFMKNDNFFIDNNIFLKQRF